MIWVELNYIRQVYESLWLFKNYNQFMVNTLKKVMLVWLILIYNFLPHEFPCEMVMTHITEMKEGGVLVDSATSLCWYLFSPYLSPSCINEVTGKGKNNLLDNGAQRRKQQMGKAPCQRRNTNARGNPQKFNQQSLEDGVDVQCPSEEWHSQRSQGRMAA